MLFVRARLHVFVPPSFVGLCLKRVVMAIRFVKSFTEYIKNLFVWKYNYYDEVLVRDKFQR